MSHFQWDTMRRAQQAIAWGVPNAESTGLAHGEWCRLVADMYEVIRQLAQRQMPFVVANLSDVWADTQAPTTKESSSMIEQKMDELIAALNANTAALKGAPVAAAKPAAPAAVKAVPTPTPAAARPVAAAKPAPAAAPGVDPRYEQARVKMKAILDDPSKGPNAVRDILAGVGATKLSDVPAEQLTALHAALDGVTGQEQAAAGAGMFD